MTLADSSTPLPNSANGVAAGLALTEPLPHPIATAKSEEPMANGREKLPKLLSPGTREWFLDSWKSRKVIQLPEYPDQSELQSVLETVEGFPPLVLAAEARTLEERLAEAATGKAFLLQGGDCAESFREFGADKVGDTFRLLLQMGIVLMFGGQLPVIKVFPTT